ncbi:transcription factor EB-like [Pollicipes pollicipes]|uniref:transcription factor EB-like n=1 Tax=Pollicipes pollicipes TaxID=41117 RepID=UPI00188521CA|nr:transcription factor EB-like [Pollicipes pollicipes]
MADSGVAFTMEDQSPAWYLTPDRRLGCGPAAVEAPGQRRRLPDDVLHPMVNIKSARTTSRTQLKQQLMRQQAEEQEARERSLRLLALQQQQQQQQQSSPVPTPQAVPRLERVDVPNKVLQVETRLQHPTPYHMLQNQKRQVREYLSHSAESPPAGPVEPPAVMSPLSNQTSASEATEVDELLDNILSLQSDHADSAGNVSCVSVNFGN